jgi:hypothetical protein
MFNKIKSKLLYYYGNLIYLLSKVEKSKFNTDLRIEYIKTKYPDLNDQHFYFHHYYWNKAPQWLREHRDYFKKDQRGFGEDAFHAMWYLIFKEYSPKSALEIGVYRGQVISLWALLAKRMGFKIEVHGISPFTAADDEVSNYLKNIDYYQDVIHNFKKCELEVVILNKGFSTDEKMIKIIKSKEWDIIYIDGNHTYEIAKQDFKNCSESVRNNGLIVMDDSALFTNYRAINYSFAGHYGPSRVAEEIDPDDFKEIISVSHNRVFQKVRRQNKCDVI